MKVVILCGGQGTRLKEETEFKPKPLVEVGGMPILWHIMKIYSHYGFKDFILCLGYKGHMIRDYFMNFDLHCSDSHIDHGSGKVTRFGDGLMDWRITFANTGLETNPGGRIKKIEKYIDGDNFMVTYGDGVADIDLNKLLLHHLNNGKIATITGVHPTSKFGTMSVEGDSVLDFFEKPVMNEWVSGGFFVFNRKVFDYFREDGEFSIEESVFKRLASERQLNLYRYHGSWNCMDTYKDAMHLNSLWNNNAAPWKVWEK